MAESRLQGSDGRLPPAEAFAAIANETRLEILEALWAASDRPVSFSTLHERVDLRDSAQFNYHLQQLTDHFVVKTDDGYDLSHAGEGVVRAVLSGSFTEDPDRTIDVEGDCVVCAGGLEATYADERITIECAACGQRHGQYPFPPGGLRGRTDREIMDAFNQRVRHLHCLAADGVCPECNGRMTTSIRRDQECCLGLEWQVEHRCEQCRHGLCSAVGLSLLDQADVVTFHRERGVDLTAIPYWQLEWCVTDRHTTILSEDPWEIRVTIPVGDDALRVTVDGDLVVQRTERVDASAVE